MFAYLYICEVLKKANLTSQKFSYLIYLFRNKLFTTLLCSLQPLTKHNYFMCNHLGNLTNF